MTDKQKRRVVLKALTVVGTMPARHHKDGRETQEHIEKLVRQYDESLNVTKDELISSRYIDKSTHKWTNILCVGAYEAVSSPSDRAQRKLFAG